MSSAAMKMSGVTVALALSLTGTFVHADAATTSLNWVQVTSTQAPAGRAWAAMSYDSLRGRTVMFGGAPNTGSNFSDTWEWDGSTWTQRTPSASPSAVLGAAMVYDSSRARSVLFGGATTPGAITSGTWEWDGTTWTQRSLAVSPPARFWHAAAYDSVRGRMVLFGGDGQSGPLGDTWEFDGASWTQKFPATSPSPRYGQAMSFDSVRNRVVLFGGFGPNGRLGDTWEWDGTNWTQQRPSTSPFPRFFASMAFDAQQSKSILFGGDYLKPNTLGPTNDMWEWDGTNWIQDYTAAVPSPRSAQSMSYDSTRARIVLFGGTDETFSNPFYGDTWELGTGIVTPPGNPTATFYPTSVNFGFDSLGVTSGPFALKLFSSGTGPLLITSFSTTGDYAVAGSDCPISPTPVAAGTSCFVSVSFTPTAVGDRAGTLIVNDNASGGSNSVALDGTGTANPATLTVNPATASFGGMAYITASLTSSVGPIYSASISFTLPNGATATVQTDVNGIATWPNASVAGINPGSYAGGIQANFAGNQGFLGTSAAATLTVNPPPIDGVLSLNGMPGNITVNATDSTGAVVTYAAPTAVDELDFTSTASVSCAPASGSTFAIGTTTVTCTATDIDDTSAAATFTVTVNDADLALTGMPANITADATGPGGAVVTYAAPAAADEASESSASAASCTPASGSTFAIGTTTVTCTATDADDSPNTVSQSFTVTVNDTDLALSGVPATMTVNATGPSGAVVAYAAPTALDEAGDSLAPAVSCAPASGFTFPIGTTTVTCVASDGDDTPASATQSFNVTVLDTDLAIIGIPGNVTVIATGSSGAVVTYALPTAVDEGGDSPAVAVSCAPASGSTFAVGTTTVTCTASSADDNPATVSATFTVTVLVDMTGSASVSPSTATTGTLVTGTVSVTNTGAVTRTATVVMTFTFNSQSGGVTVNTTKAVVKLDAGQSATRTFTFKVSKSSARGAYSFVATVSDVTGTVSSSATFTVT
jgi:hypothetical protein